MATTLAQCRRTLLYHLGHGIVLMDLLTKRLTHSIRRQLTITPQSSIQTAMDHQILREESLQLALYHRIALLKHQDLITFRHDLLHLLTGQWILRDLQDRMPETIGITVSPMPCKAER